MQDVAARTEGQLKLSPGTLYGPIKRMFQDGLINEIEERPDPERDDERRRYYGITRHGRNGLTVRCCCSIRRSFAATMPPISTCIAPRPSLSSQQFASRTRSYTAHVCQSDFCAYSENRRTLASAYVTPVLARIIAALRTHSRAGLFAIDSYFTKGPVVRVSICRHIADLIHGTQLPAYLRKDGF